MKKGCVVGMGAIGPVHAAGLEPRGSLYGICDNQAQRLAGFQPENEKLRRYADLRSVLEDPLAEVVHICTPHCLHRKMTVAALEAGRAVVLEKPAAMNLEELADVRACAERTGGQICVMLQNRINPAVRRLKTFLETDRSLGKVLGITGFLTWCRDAAYYAQDPWRGKWRTEGGGLLINQAIHTIDLMGYLGGRITEVRGSISNKTLNGIVEVEDTADAVFETETGLRMCFYATNGYAFSDPVRLEVRMEKGLLRYADNRLYRVTDDTCEVLAYDTPEHPGKACWGGGHRTVIEGFYQYLETGEGEYVTLADAVPAMETLFAFYQSAREDRAVLV